MAAGEIVQNKMIPLMRPNLSEEDISSVVSVLRSGMLIQGREVEKLEQQVSGLTGASHAAAVSNGTATMHLALIALGIGPGDEVIVPAFSYVATANVVELVGAKCVFVEIDIDTFNIDPTRIEEAITPSTKAIIPVHEFGLAADITEIMRIAEKHGLFVVEDAACALGAAENGRAVGSFGHFGSFSLHPRKAITSGEGGVLTTSDPALHKKITILRNHGIDMQEGKMQFVAAGFNYRLTDFQAALVNSQMPRLAAQIEYKQKLAEVYFRELTSDAFKLPSVPAGKNHTWQTFHVVVDDKLNRDEVINYLKEKNVGSNYGAQCIPAQIYYREKYSLDCEALFPNALKAYRQGLAIPLYELLAKEDISYISKCLNNY
jgi:perosamine synthetase